MERPLSLSARLLLTFIGTLGMAGAMLAFSEGDPALGWLLIAVALVASIYLATHYGR